MSTRYRVNNYCIHYLPHSFYWNDDVELDMPYYCPYYSCKYHANWRVSVRLHQFHLLPIILSAWQGRKFPASSSSTEGILSSPIYKSPYTSGFAGRLHSKRHFTWRIHSPELWCSVSETHTTSQHPDVVSGKCECRSNWDLAAKSATGSSQIDIVEWLCLTF